MIADEGPAALYGGDVGRRYAAGLAALGVPIDLCRPRRAHRRPRFAPAGSLPRHRRAGASAELPGVRAARGVAGDRTTGHRPRSVRRRRRRPGRRAARRGARPRPPPRRPRPDARPRVDAVGRGPHRRIVRRGPGRAPAGTRRAQALGRHDRARDRRHRRPRRLADPEPVRRVRRRAPGARRPASSRRTVAPASPSTRRAPTCSPPGHGRPTP